MISDQELRAEIWKNRVINHHTAPSYMAALLVMGGALSLGKQPKISLALRTTQSAMLALECLEFLYGYRAELGIETPGDKRKMRKYTLELPASLSARVLADCRMCNTQDGVVIYMLGLTTFKWVQPTAYCMALYLECGKLYSTQDYRLNWCLPAQSKRLQELVHILDSLQIKFLHTISEDKLSISFRNEAVADMAVLMGAQNCGLEIQDFYLERRVNGQVTRSINCQTSNMDKAFESATHQLLAIETLKAVGQFESLPTDVRSVALARLAMPTASIQAIADYLETNKSWVYRRMKTITDFAAAYRE